MRDGYKPRPNDVWAIGVCLYTYLTEKLPFNGESDIEVQIATKEKKLDYDEWMSDDMKQMFDKLLHRDPKERYTLSQLKECKWFLS